MQFNFDPDKQDHLAPAEIRSPYHFAQGGYANSFDPPMNTESQINSISQTDGGQFGGMGNQYNISRPPLSQPTDTSPPYSVSNSPGSNLNGYLMGNTIAPMQPNQLIPSQNQTNQTQIPTYTPNSNTPQTNSPSTNAPYSYGYGNNQSLPASGQQNSSPLTSFAKGGAVEMNSLISTIKSEFEKRGLDFDKIIAARLAHLAHQKSQ